MVRIKKSIIAILVIFLISHFSSSYITNAEDENLPDLTIEYPSQVNESFPFFVTIKSNNISIGNATVTFNGKTNVTNSSGMAGFSAPRVLPDGDNSFTITAFKEGYNSTTVHITVANVPQVFPIVIVSNIAEETSFVVTAIDDEGRIIDNATITFNNKEYMSSINGTVTLAAPSVKKTKTFVISATKPGYIDYSIFITIYPALSPENLVGFFIVIGICIIIIVTTIVIMFMKHLKRKRINRL